VLTSATCVAHPPPITNCGGRIAFAPPMLPAEPDPAGRIRVGPPVSVPVLAAPSVLKFVPANGKPRTAKGEPLWTLTLPMNAVPTSSGNNSFTNVANCLYGSILTVVVLAVVPSLFFSVIVIAFDVQPGLTITRPTFRLALFRKSMNKVAPVVTPNGTTLA